MRPELPHSIMKQEGCEPGLYHTITHKVQRDKEEAASCFTPRQVYMSDMQALVTLYLLSVDPGSLSSLPRSSAPMRDLQQCKKTPDERAVWWTGCCPRASPRTLSRQRGTTPTLLLLSPPDVPAVERMWPFKSEGVGWAEIHDGLITLSVVKLKLYIQSIGFMTPLQHLIEIKCQNAWLPRASNDAN